MKPNKKSSWLALLLLVMGTAPPMAVGSAPPRSSNRNRRAMFPTSVRGTTSTARPSSVNLLCSTIGATYVTWPASPQPACRLYVQHQGMERFADVYFPAGYSASSQAALWFIFHGLYSVKPASADGGPPPIGGLDHIKRAAEHVAGSMGINKGWLAREAILVYPDSGGKLPGFQMWNSGYWQCPYKSHPSHCMDSKVDDVGFLEGLTKALQDKLPSKPTDVYALGFSNGGMILQTLLCKSPYLRATLTGAALVNTVLRKAYLDKECTDAPAAAANGSSSSQQQQQHKVPLVIIHGMQDTLFPFFEGSNSATGDVLLSTLEMADDWAAKYGCSGSKGKTPLVLIAGEGVACRDLCTAAAGGSSGDGAAAGQLPASLWLCGMQQTGHDWTPFKADLAWTFFTQREQQPEALPEPKFPTWQVPGAAAAPPPADDEAPPPTPPPAQPVQQLTPAQPSPKEPSPAAAAAAPALQQPASVPAAAPSTRAAAAPAAASSAAAQASGKGAEGCQKAPAAAAAPAAAPTPKQAKVVAPAPNSQVTNSQSAQARPAPVAKAAPAGKAAASAAAATAAASAAAAPATAPAAAAALPDPAPTPRAAAAAPAPTQQRPPAAASLSGPVPVAEGGAKAAPAAPAAPRPAAEAAGKQNTRGN